MTQSFQSSQPRAPTASGLVCDIQSREPAGADDALAFIFSPQVSAVYRMALELKADIAKGMFPKGAEGEAQRLYSALRCYVEAADRDADEKCKAPPAAPQETPPQAA